MLVVMTDPASTLDLSRPFTRADGLSAGLTDRQLQSARFERPHTGVYVLATTELTPAIRAEAALLASGPGAFASHATAGRLWGVPLPPLADEHVTVREPRSRRQRSGIRCHLLHAGADAEVWHLDGLSVSGPAQLFVELATQLSLVDLVVVGDRLVRQGHLTVARLLGFVHRWRGPGAAQARAAAAFVRERVDSPMETRLRMLIVLAGLPEPRVNVTYSEDGLVRRKYDLSWPEVRLIVEFDGRHHVERIEQWESDLGRREAIDDSGWRIVVVIASGIYRHPDQTLAKIHRLLLERRMPGTPKRLRAEWRRHFVVPPAPAQDRA
jgi:hypothetical protein